LWDAPPLPLRLGDAAELYGKRHSVYEKNWMPFIAPRSGGSEAGGGGGGGEGGGLYVVHAPAPSHRVYRIRPDGIAERVRGGGSGVDGGEGVDGQAAAAAKVFAALPVAPEKLHGGPPLVYIPSGGSSSGEDGGEEDGSESSGYLLGVVHFWEPRTGTKDGRRYRHYLYKASPRPPFAPLQVSAELPLRTHPAYRAVTFASGLALSGGDSGSGGDNSSGSEARVLVSYGSGDAVGRVLTLTLREVEALFARAKAGESSSDSSSNSDAR
jgi:hypothetical protein